MQNLGVQDVARKKKTPSLNVGAWEGCIPRANEEVVHRTFTQETWDKGKRCLEDLKIHMGKRENHKYLLRVRGNFNNLAIVHADMLPFFKWFHNTIDSWRNGEIDKGGKEIKALGRMCLGTNYVKSGGRKNEDEFDQLMKDN